MKLKNLRGCLGYTILKKRNYPVKEKLLFFSKTGIPINQLGIIGCGCLGGFQKVFG